METFVNPPKWQALYEKSFPAEKISATTNIPQTAAPSSTSQTIGINPWVVVGVAALVCITIYIVWDQQQVAKKAEHNTQA